MKNVSRRNVVRSAGWVAPAVVAATAIPAYAVSSTLPPTDFNGNSRVVRTSTQQLQIRLYYLLAAPRKSDFLQLPCIGCKLC